MERFEKKKKWRISINEEVEDVEAIVSDIDVVVCYSKMGHAYYPKIGTGSLTQRKKPVNGRKSTFMSFGGK